MAINLKKKLSHLPDEKIRHLELITEFTVASGKAEMVILYGSHARGDFKRERIEEVGGHNVYFSSDYDILVITDTLFDRTAFLERHEPSLRKTVTSAECDLRKMMQEIKRPVQMIVEQIEDVNRYLEERRYFYLDIYREGIVLYDSGKCQLIEPPDDITPALRRQHAEEDFEEWFNFGEEFIDTAQDCTSKKRYKLASFLLEQAFEKFYLCVVLVYTHYAPDEHSLYKLREEAEKHDSRLKKIHPLNTPEERTSFKKLHRAYIEARFFREFPVELSEIEYWYAEAEKLRDVVQETCELKIEFLRLIKRRWKPET